MFCMHAFMYNLMRVVCACVMIIIYTELGLLYIRSKVLSWILSFF